MPVLSKHQESPQKHFREKKGISMLNNVHETSAGRTLVDDSLTSLNWLHNLNIMGEMSASTPPTPPASPGPMGPPSSTNTTLYSNVEGYAIHHHSHPTISNRQRGRCGQNVLPENVDYKTNGDVKPPYSYATLIYMAMKANKNKMSLSAIYKWIRDNFMYYRQADTGWQNSIRHNLSLNHCFVKVPRNKDEPGKGGFWRLDPTYTEEMSDGTFKKRRLTNRPSVTKKPHGKLVKDLQIGCENSNRCSSSSSSSSPSLYGGVSSSLQDHSMLAQSRASLGHDSGCERVDGIGMMELSSHHHHHHHHHLLTTLANMDSTDTPDEESEAAIAVASLKGDFCWNSVLNEDIEVDGLPYKTAEIVDMDNVTSVAVELSAYRSPHSNNHHQPHPAHQQHHSRPAVAVTNQALNSMVQASLSSPALSLVDDDDDLLAGSNGSDHLSDELQVMDEVARMVPGGQHNQAVTPISNAEWWRLTSTDAATSVIGTATGDLNQSPFILGPLSTSSVYDVNNVTASNFLGNNWDEASRSVLEGSLDLEGLIDLDVY